MCKKILFYLLVMFFLTPTSIKADGGIMPRPDTWIYETGQKAVIYYEKDLETLVLQTSFIGEAKDFAYIVPTPSKPEVSKVSEDIFTNLQKMTNFEFFDPLIMLNSDQAVKEITASVEVVEEKQVGIYEVKILSATDKEALYNWLKDNNFNYPENKKYILDDYISNKWFFTTAKISTQALSENVDSKLKEGSLTPLKLVFVSKNMVYPLKISAVMDEDKAKNHSEANFLTVPINLYIFSDHKKELAGFDTLHANWIKPEEIKKLAKDDNGNYWVSPKNKMFLTKLSSYLSVSEMTNDLFPDNAPNNKLVGVLSSWQKFLQWGLKGWFNIIEIIALIVFFIFFYKQSKLLQKNNRFFLIEWVSWILASFVIIFTTLPYSSGDYSTIWQNFAYIDSAGISQIIVSFALMAVMLVLLIRQRTSKLE